MGKELNFSMLKGMTLTSVDVTDDSVLFSTIDNREFKLYHAQDCCEHVYVEDVCGDIEDLVGQVVLHAEEANSPDRGPKSDYQDSYTWTYYKIDTIRGGVTIRFYGTSNGYYSERVQFVETH